MIQFYPLNKRCMVKICCRRLSFKRLLGRSVFNFDLFEFVMLLLNPSQNKTQHLPCKRSFDEMSVAYVFLVRKERGYRQVEIDSTRRLVAQSLVKRAANITGPNEIYREIAIMNPHSIHHIKHKLPLQSTSVFTAKFWRYKFFTHLN